MPAYDPARYGEAVGDDYDALYPEGGLDSKAAVAHLAGLARARPEQSVLEFGIGTGRLALGLKRLGLSVAGIDGYEGMLTKLRAKPGCETLDVVLGDYRNSQVPGSFGVVALVFNGILDPRGRPAQLDIFRNAARHLGVGGYFVVESFVLSDAQRSGDWSVQPRYVGEEHVELQVMRYDIATNQVERTLVHLRPQGLNFLNVFDGYAAPGELDVMAEVTGFTLNARTANWNGDAFTSSSSNHVSVYELVRHV